MGRLRSSAIRLVAAVAAAAVVFGGCGGRQTTTEQTSAPRERARLANPSDFPLYPRSEVVAVVPISSAQMVAAMRASDPHADVPKNFHGHEVIAETSASMRQLGAWIAALKASPPRGLHKLSDRSSPSGLNENGPDTAVGATFQTADGERSVFVVAADPRKLHEAMGPVFTLIDSYSAVPGVVRGPIDEQAKQQLGYSVTEMLDVKSPVGAAVATVKRLPSGDRRAILIVDESKAK